MKLSDGIRVIAINPGSTSTKIAVYENETPVLIKNITHTPEELAPFEKITDQFEIKLGNILEHKMSGIRDTTLTSNNILSNQNNTLQVHPIGLQKYSRKSLTEALSKLL